MHYLCGCNKTLIHPLMETNQPQNTNPQQAIPLDKLPPTIFGFPTKDAITVGMGVALAAIGINNIINSKKK